MPSSGPVISRRDALLGAAAIALVGATSGACASPTPQPVIDDLVAQRDMAQQDSDLAAAAAKGGDPDYVPAFNVVAAERAAHAKTLAQEIGRAAGPAATSTPSATTAPASGATAPPPPSLADVRTALGNSAASATQLAVNLSGYRAGLLGSIAASCNAALAVPLAMKKPTS